MAYTSPKTDAMMLVTLPKRNIVPDIANFYKGIASEKRSLESILTSDPELVRFWRDCSIVAEVNLDAGVLEVPPGEEDDRLCKLLENFKSLYNDQKEHKWDDVFAEVNTDTEICGITMFLNSKDCLIPSPMFISWLNKLLVDFEENFKRILHIFKLYLRNELNDLNVTFKYKDAIVPVYAPLFQQYGDNHTMGDLISKFAKTFIYPRIDKNIFLWYAPKNYQPMFELPPEYDPKFAIDGVPIIDRWFEGYRGFYSGRIVMDQYGLKVVTMLLLGAVSNKYELDAINQSMYDFRSKVYIMCKYALSTGSATNIVYGRVFKLCMWQLMHR